jgi:tyrosyl-tRNA synthetase
MADQLPLELNLNFIKFLSLLKYLNLKRMREREREKKRGRRKRERYYFFYFFYTMNAKPDSNQLYAFRTLAT